MKITPPEQFMKSWDDAIISMTNDDLHKWLSETSTHHPNENMAWLYDRLLYEIAERINNNVEI